MTGFRPNCERNIVSKVKFNKSIVHFGPSAGQGYLIFDEADSNSFNVPKTLN